MNSFAYIGRNAYLTPQFFLIWGSLVIYFILSYFITPLFALGPYLLSVIGILTLLDLYWLFRTSEPVSSTRSMSELLSLGYSESVTITVQNHTDLLLKIQILDEVPFEFQIRDLHYSTSLEPNGNCNWTYHLIPKDRGTYEFGQTILLLESPLGLISRRIVTGQSSRIPVYPSVKLVREMQTILATPLAAHYGIKQVRRIGQSQEFDHIRHYVTGDDFQRINWKASSRGQDLQVNHYEDERAQPIYLLLDRSRSMQLPFDGLTLLDHSINAGLVLANTALAKYDQIGLLSFAEKTDVFLQANASSRQKHLLLEQLFDLQSSSGESDYEMLYSTIRRSLKVRSLLFLFVNFESLPAFERVLPILRLINKRHLLVPVFFENTELERYVQDVPNDLRMIYHHTLAEKILAEKKQMIYQMGLHGIQSLYTKPEELTINLINRYLEMKARTWR